MGLIFLLMLLDLRTRDELSVFSLTYFLRARVNSIKFYFCGGDVEGSFKHSIAHPFARDEFKPKVRSGRRERRT